MKGSIKIGNKGKRFKESLMVIQFAVSCVLILASVFMYRQLNFLRNQDIGIEKDGILTLQLYDQKSQDNVDLLIPELASLAGVQNIAASRFTPGTANWHQTVSWEDQVEDVSWNLISVDKNFIETFGLELVEGNLENIKAISESQSWTYIINESARENAGWQNGAGKVISAFGKNGNSSVAGVVKNFNYKSLHNSIEPVVLVISNNPHSSISRYSQVSINFSSDDPTGLIADIEANLPKSCQTRLLSTHLPKTSSAVFTK